ncbi:peptide deformylase [Hominifimenecus microfluidus]|uniref:peptide deformylase n=1 Tax=Hominifimenecus microfluidus TaxID=2885348 RepID=UPI0032BFFCB4
MALRNIRTIGDEILRKEAKSVKAMTPRTEKLIEDMLDTMYDAYGVGLAAPQVGILKRIVVIDVSENQDAPYVLINPEIIETSGSQTGSEGCLSVPGKHATVTRPDYAKVRAQDENMEWFELEGEGLLARAICHECDHLDGILYVDKKEGPLLDNEEPQEEEE